MSNYVWFANGDLMFKRTTDQSRRVPSSEIGYHSIFLFVLIKLCVINGFHGVHFYFRRRDIKYKCNTNDLSTF